VVQEGGAAGFSAFVPRPLPPEPPLRLTAELQGTVDRANQALGRLDGITRSGSEPPVYQALSRLEDLGIVREITGRRRGRVYAYDQYLALLNADTESALT
jgi:hypothetical protein